MLGIPVGLVYTNVGEWLIHKHILHGLGRDRRNFWSFHWHEHHRASRKEGMLDPDYRRSLWGWHAQTKEALGLLMLGLAHAPLLPFFPYFTGTVWWHLAYYYRTHKRAHLDPAWAEVHLPWHVDHHMGLNQDANWCVTRPWADNWFKTRVGRHEKPPKKARPAAPQPAAEAA
jgi:sterol desaturase/sphingolipid hydroxylase (fatty acid hydroxylase superfamily)